jgi:dephospho-CoA kinase
MIIVGLTGGIGAGKSTVSAMLAQQGAVIVDADQIARDLQGPGTPVVLAMAERFGSGILDENQGLIRSAVAEIVFADPAALADLNKIVHPAMQAEIAAQIDAHRGTDRIVILDFPLLTENPRSDLNATIVVDVDPEIAISRVVTHRGMDEADARARVARQAKREDRLAIATHVIDNSGDAAALGERVAEVWSELLVLAATSGS